MGEIKLDEKAIFYKSIIDLWTLLAQTLPTDYPKPVYKDMEEFADQQELEPKGDDQVLDFR